MNAHDWCSRTYHSDGALLHIEHTFVNGFLFGREFAVDGIGAGDVAGVSSRIPRRRRPAADRRLPSPLFSRSAGCRNGGPSPRCTGSRCASIRSRETCIRERPGFRILQSGKRRISWLPSGPAWKFPRRARGCGVALQFLIQTHFSEHVSRIDDLRRRMNADSEFRSHHFEDRKIR